MKSLITLLFSLFFSCLLAQPTITKPDMPLAGDTIKTSSTILGLGINYQQTGQNFTWDFSSLVSSTGGADTFISVTSTPLVYQLAFNLPFDPFQANLASPQADLSLIPNMPLTDIINFYKSATASYAECGFGAKVAGIPIPIKFNALDVLYTFPLTANSTPDSSEVSFSQGITGIGYLSIQRKRVNTVDGWGTMITPAGSYSTIRVKSVVQETDSIYVDSLSIGFAIPRNYTEYKWLANGKGIPVMKVSNQNIVPAFTWIDSAAVSNPFSVDIGIDQTVCENTSVQLTATITGGTPPYFYIWSNGSMGQTITVTPAVTTTYTVTVTDAGFQFATDAITIAVIPAPVVSIVPDPNTSTGCSGPPPNVTVFTLNATPGFNNYSWSTGQSGTNMASITTGPPSSGYVGNQDYTVTVSDQVGCLGQNTISILWALCSGIHETQPGDASFNLFPNPTTGIVNLEYQDSGNKIQRFEIFKSGGELVSSFIPHGISFIDGSQSIDLKAYTGKSGLYFIRLVFDNGSRVKPVVIE